MNRYNIYSSFKVLQEQIDRMPGVQKTDQQGDTTLIDLFDFCVKDYELNKTTKKLFIDGHHARAVEEGFKFLNNLVKKRTGVDTIDGAQLMQKAFSSQTPLLKLNAGTTKSEEDEQKGYQLILAGCITGIRNPRAHENEWEDSETRALQLLSLANHLVERVRQSLKVNV